MTTVVDVDSSEAFGVGHLDFQRENKLKITVSTDDESYIACVTCECGSSRWNMFPLQCTTCHRSWSDHIKWLEAVYVKG